MRKNGFIKFILFLLTNCLIISASACNAGGNTSNSNSGSSGGSSITDGSESSSTGDSTSSDNSDSSGENDNQGGNQTGNENQGDGGINIDSDPLVDFTVNVEEDRDIRVLQITDIQTIDGTQQRYQARIGTAWTSGRETTISRYKNPIRQVVEKYNPDLILLTGDNNYGEFDDSGEAFVEMVKFMDSLKTPWAPIMGNHDAETNMGVDWMCQQYENAQYCLFKQRTLTGNGNYTVGVAQGGELKRVFYMMDSNGSGNLSKASLENGHTVSTQGFGADQIEWYTKHATRLKEQSPSVKISFCFHIPIQAFVDAASEYGYNRNTVDSNAINLDKVGKTGDFGIIGNSINAFDSDNKVWNGLKALGVDSIFVGHEHRCSFSINYQGVRLTFGQKSSTYDTINYYYDDVDYTGGARPSNSSSQGVAVIGGTAIPVSADDGAINNAHIVLYDKNDANFIPEVDPGLTDGIPGVPTVNTVSETVGSYRNNTFTRHTLETLGIPKNVDGTSSFEFAVNEEKFSISFKIKTNKDFTNGKLRFYFFTNEGARNDCEATISASGVTVGSHTLSYSFKANTEYDIELGALKLYNGRTVYLFVKINGELGDRWAIEEVLPSELGSVVYVTESGKTNFGTFVR